MEQQVMEVTAFDHIVFNVSDVERSAAWYASVLGMERHDSRAEDGSTRTSMTFGINKINLRPLSASQEEWFTAHTPAAGSADLCFLTDIPPGAVADHFRVLGVAIEQGPVTRNGARGPIRSAYVRDPDGSLIEVASYE
ncbi:Catechol 2,3-dioxygenase [Sphingomonas gellani]|uniref:Catechol 2,3-dioxygenase n=1 Tax=Sphingomonas gellani TaxID=1166340 RepID=A0A1H8G2E3_9SPHN|nr:VOC family protein [Sphingomonas gellani]SEN38156.1 Catechol 2,3-dioxygenase [Sphingomonas gellani]